MRAKDLGIWALMAGLFLGAAAVSAMLLLGANTLRSEATILNEITWVKFVLGNFIHIHSHVLLIGFEVTSYIFAKHWLKNGFTIDSEELFTLLKENKLRMVLLIVGVSVMAVPLTVFFVILIVN